MAVEDAKLEQLGLDEADAPLQPDEANLAKMFEERRDAVPDCIDPYRHKSRSPDISITLLRQVVGIFQALLKTTCGTRDCTMN